MIIQKIVQALVPSIEKNQILEDIDTTIAELNDQTLPVYAQSFDASLFTETYNAKSRWLNEKQRDFRRARVSQHPSIHVYIYGVLQSIPERLEWLRKQIAAEKTTTIVKAGIDYKMSNLLHLVSAAGFMSKYARKFLLTTYCYEMPEYFKEMKRELPFSKVELSMIEEQYNGFMELLGIFTMAPNKMYERLSSIPEYIVEGLDDESIASAPEVLEPIPCNFVPLKYHPIYHIRMAIADWQHSRYLAAKDEKQAIELRLIAMRNSRDAGEVDPALKKQIEMTEKRVMNLNYKLAKMEAA